MIGVEKPAMHCSGASAGPAMQEEDRRAARIARLLPVHRVTRIEPEGPGPVGLDRWKEVAAVHHRRQSMRLCVDYIARKSYSAARWMGLAERPKMRRRVRRNRRIAPRSAPNRPVEGVEGWRPVAGGDAAPDEIDQVGVDRPPGGAAQPRLESDIELAHDRIDLLDAVAQAVEDAGFALAAMSDEGADEPLRLGNRRSMGRPIDRAGAGEQFIEGRH